MNVAIPLIPFIFMNETRANPKRSCDEICFSKKRQDGASFGKIYTINRMRKTRKRRGGGWFGKSTYTNNANKALLKAEVSKRLSVMKGNSPQRAQVEGLAQIAATARRDYKSLLTRRGNYITQRDAIDYEIERIDEEMNYILMQEKNKQLQILSGEIKRGWFQ
jgi:hypothetical protein